MCIYVWMWQIKTIIVNIYKCHMLHTISRIYCRNVTKIQKFINWKFSRFVTYTWRKFLPVWNVVYITAAMKMYSYRHFILTLSCQVVTKCHKNLNKPATKSCRFVLMRITFCLLPPGIQGLNSHKNRSMISTLIIEY